MRLLITRILSLAGVALVAARVPHCKLHYTITQEPKKTHNSNHIVMKDKVILLILGGLGYFSARKLMGHLDGWGDSGEANVWNGQSALPSISSPCYGIIQAGLPPPDHVIAQTALYRAFCNV